MLLLLQPSLQGAVSGAVPLLLNGSIIPDVAEPEVGVQHRLMGQQARVYSKHAAAVAGISTTVAP